MEQTAFDELKRMLSETPISVHYDPSLPSTLACDVSGTGIGAVISHEVPDGKEHPVAFTSRTQASAEQSYSQLEREALGIVFRVTKFHQYIYGRQFTLITDNRPLAGILGPKRGIPPIAEMQLRQRAVISADTYMVITKSTTDNANADCMSRLPLTQMEDEVEETPMILSIKQDNLPVKAEDIRQFTTTDFIL